MSKHKTVADYASMGGIARWAKIPKSKRKEIMRKVSLAPRRKK